MSTGGKLELAVLYHGDSGGDRSPAAESLVHD